MPCVYSFGSAVSSHLLEATPGRDSFQLHGEPLSATADIERLSRGVIATLKGTRYSVDRQLCALRLFVERHLTMIR